MVILKVKQQNLLCYLPFKIFMLQINSHFLLYIVQYWINKSFMQPNGQYVYGGGHGATFFEISPGIWEYQWTDTVSKYAPSGTYTYMYISVKNEGLLQSDEWATIELNINNSKSEDIFPDGVIDIKDLALLGLYYNCTSTDINWKSEYDFNNDLIIDIYDLIYIATKFN